MKQGRKKLREDKALKHVVSTRINQSKYEELMEIRSHPPHHKMSDLVRKIVENRRIKIFTHDKSLDPVMLELQSIRQKIRITGTIINQYTKSFNSHTHPAQKQFYAKMVFAQYASLAEYIDRLTPILRELAKRWLDENDAKNPT